MWLITLITHLLTGLRIQRIIVIILLKYSKFCHTRWTWFNFTEKGDSAFSETWLTHFGIYLSFTVCQNKEWRGLRWPGKSQGPMWVRMVKHHCSQGNLMHCRLQGMTSRWALEWKLIKCAVCKPWKDPGRAGCVCHHVRGCSSCDSLRDQPSAMSHDAISFQKMLLVQGVFW